MQVAGVTSIFPFLALASDPGQIHRSQVGRWFVERFPNYSENDFLVAAGILAVFILLLSNGVNLLSDYGRNRYAYSFGHWLRIQLIGEMSRRPYSFFLGQNSGVLVKKTVMDVYGFSSGVLLPMLDATGRAITCALLVLTLIVVNPAIALGACLVVGGLYGIVFFVQKPLRLKVSKGLKAANRGNMVAVQQFFGGIKPILIHGKSGHFIEDVAVHSALQARFMAVAPLLGSIPRYIIEPLAFGGLVVFLTLRISNGANLIEIMPAVSVMALAGYKLIPAVQLLYGQISQIGTQLHAFEEVYDEFHGVEKAAGNRPEDSSRSKPDEMTFNRRIRFENVSFSYAGSESPVLSEVNLEITKGSNVGIVGVTGSGKSTLVDLLLGLHRPSEGRILVDDTPLSNQSMNAWRKLVGYVPQEIFLVDGTIAENIALGVRQDDIDTDRVQEVAKISQISEHIENLTDRYETEVGERGVRLSGGQRQRIGLARALYHRPLILVLDEATSALDQETEAAVMKTVGDLASEFTIIQISHRPATVARCSKTCTVSRGSIVSNL